MNLTESIKDIWRDTVALNNATTGIPFSRVFVGRVPSTELKRFPYMRIASAGASGGLRTSHAQYPHVTVSFHCWLDPADLAHGQAIQNVVADVFANNCWQLEDGYFVRDVLDEGPPIEHEINQPGIRAWEVVKLFTFVLERRRVDTSSCCDVSGI